mgnify:FL=1
MEKIEIILPLKINSKLSLNKLYGCHCHWSVRERKAKEVHKKVKLQLISDKVRKRLFDTKISIEFFWNSRLDLDNHGYAAKLIIDGLKGYLIKDDNRKYISKITHHFWKGKGVKIIISTVE